jgi:hypothetical protein
MKKFIMSKYALFLTALLQVTFVAMNVIFISGHYIIPMLVTGFLISLVWTLNVKKVAFGGWTDRIVYSTGALCGTGIGYVLSDYIIKYL